MISYVYTVDIYYPIVITVTFNESSYNVNEGNGKVQLILLLSNPSSTNITIQLRDRQNTAKSKPNNVLH